MPATRYIGFDRILELFGIPYDRPVSSDLITFKGFMIYLLKVSLQDISELKSERLALRKRMDGQTLHLRKFSGSRANFQAFVEETIREGGQEIQDFHNLARGVSLITFETRRTALEALLLLQTQLDTQESPFRFD